MEFPKSVILLMVLFTGMGILFLLVSYYKFGESEVLLTNRPNTDYIIFIQKNDIPYSHISSTIPRESQLEVSSTYYKFLLNGQQIDDLLIKSGYDKFIQLPRISPSNNGGLYRVVLYDNVNIPKIQEIIKFSALIQPEYDWVNMSDKTDTYIVWVEGEMPSIPDNNGVIKSLSKYYYDEKIDPELLLRFSSQDEISNIILFVYDPNQTRDSSITDTINSYGIEINDVKYVQNSNNTLLQQYNIKSSRDSFMKFMNSSPYVVLVY